ncbi:hypothetical protein WJX72_007002 [[Myrmecia] bisecta]|uniref:Uncharacterized protein n=1 Tax=[Myrmecia] bisecta TaxID=41462 RepID=A0AAW1PP10_9CHLO
MGSVTDARGLRPGVCCGPSLSACPAYGRRPVKRRQQASCKAAVLVCGVQASPKRQLSTVQITRQAWLRGVQRPSRCSQQLFHHTTQGQRHHVVALATRRRGSQLVVAAVVAEQEGATDIHALLDQELQQNPELVLGELENGLRYVILPNKVPPNRFEAHLEVHAGSVHEHEDEQGVAHLVEHVTFLGSRRREGLLGTGARSNAYTDFHHTVFHVHSPLLNGNTHQPMLPQVMEALAEIAFDPEFLYSRIEKERRAVMAEAQMMNTIEYRVDCQLLQYLHEENALGFRFPIGKMEQVKQWDGSVLRNFWEKWYFPANATLYVVGELDCGVEATKQLIQQVFGKVAPGRERIPGTSGNGSNGNQADALPLGPEKQRQKVLPPVVHRFGHDLLQQRAPPAQVNVFRHRLLQHFMLSLFCKLPIQPVTHIRDLRRAFMVRILLSVLQFRINGRYVTADPPFIGIDLDHSDSGREGCAVSTLTITSEPKDWRGATQVAIQEVRRLQKYGVTKGELERYKVALLRDSEQLAEQAGAVPSQENLDFMMEMLALGHTIQDQREGHVKLQQVADTVTMDEVNGLAKSLLAYAAHYRNEDQLRAEAEQNPGAWASPGPSQATAIVACLPAYTDASGHSTGDGMPLHRGASLTTSQHIDPVMVDAPEAAMADDEADADMPEGAVRWDLSAQEIADAIAEESLEVEAMPDIDVPTSLLPEEDLARLLEERRPHFVPLGGEGTAGPATPPPDPVTGIVQRRLSNGVRVNMRKTKNEPRAAMLRLTCAGGRACEGEGAGPSGVGVVSIGTRTLSESGTVGAWNREQVELFCISKLINCALEADEEFLCMEFQFAIGDGGMKAVLELLHLFLEQPRWETAAMERAKQMYRSHYNSLHKGLERATADRLMAAMLGPDRRFRDANPEEIDALTLEGMRDAVMRQIHPDNIEISIVGDVDQEELDQLLPSYLGTISRPAEPPALVNRPIRVQLPPQEVRQQRWHLKDSDERACAYIAGRAPNRWGSFQSLTPPTSPPEYVMPPIMPGANASLQEKQAAALVRRAHPLYASVTLQLLTEIVNSRLFTTVRDALGLTYDVSFELSLFDRLNAGWFVVNVTSTPQKIQEALEASLRVLRTVGTSRITPRELQRAKRTVITRHESELKNNVYWLGLLTHLQCSAVPLKTLECLRDLKDMYAGATIDDVYEAFDCFELDDEHVFTCTGTSGRNPPVFKDASAPAAAAQPPQSWTMPSLVCLS